MDSETNGHEPRWEYFGIVFESELAVLGFEPEHIQYHKEFPSGVFELRHCICGCGRKEAVEVSETAFN